MKVAVTALGGIPRELMNLRDRLQIQLLISVELINQYSYGIGSFMN